VVRNPLSLQGLVHLDGQQSVIYKALRHNPTLGRNFETMDPLEWLARMADHIPDPGKHRTLFYSYYANRVRGDRAREEPGEAKVEAEPAKKRGCSASWARLIAKVVHADPLTCCNYLGLSPPEEPKPPPAVHEVVRVPVDEEGREMQAP